MTDPTTDLTLEAERLLEALKLCMTYVLDHRTGHVWSLRPDQEPAVLAAIASALRAVEARTSARVWREAADTVDEWRSETAWVGLADALRQRADKIERGEG